METAAGRVIGSLPLSRSTVKLLEERGFRLVSDLFGLKPLDLADELGVPVTDAVHIIEAAGLSKKPNAGRSATELFQDPSVERHIVTFCKSLDTLLGGGVPTGQLTEFCGVPGIGKTQLGIQLALDAQIPLMFRGRGGTAIYLDTEGSFIPERAATMAEALVKHIKSVARMHASQGDEATQRVRREAAENFTSECLLGGINVFRAHDLTEQLAIINHFPAYLNQNPGVKIIIIDSIAFHFRQDTQNQATRGRVLSALSQTLNELAFKHNLAVVIMNHVTNRVDQETRSSQLIPALSELWSHCVTNRLFLQWEGGNRIATLTKSPAMPPGKASYIVTSDGVRGAPSGTSAAAGSAGMSSHGNQRSIDDGESDPAKRQKMFHDAS